ncbi:hypothetical protein FSP39_004149 [Pinctada imbricata]|uniref:Uncharacterized protein n=1 Tax=Pinctada imbricata TaxID=66713 RepID=A0AA89C320_PINIB|nr:hypothetical protein FSP39_004149 [Pinctada imbricata]
MIRHSSKIFLSLILPGTNVHEQSRSDNCKLRFKSEGYSKIMAINRHIAAPGATVYYSMSRKRLEHSNWVNTTEEGLRFILHNPTRYREYMAGIQSHNDVGHDEAESLSTDSEKLAEDRFHIIVHKKNNNYYYTDDPISDGLYGNRNRLQRYDLGEGRGIMDNIYMKPTSVRRGRSALTKTQNSKRHLLNEKTNFHRKHKKRKWKRHVGPHDQEGIQRLLSTGSLAPTTLPVDHPLFNHSIDLVFATYWFFPAKTRVLLPKDQQCIDEKLKNEAIRFNIDSPYYGLDHDGYKHSITDECLDRSDHDLPDDHTYQSQTSYDPFNIHMGQMTVYRLRLTCKCGEKKKESDKSRCSQILPYNQQQWGAYMGTYGDSHWIPRRAKQ